MTFLKSAMTSAALLAGGAFGLAPDNADAQVRFQIGIGSGGFGNSGFGNSGLGFGNGGYYRSPDFGYRNFGRSYSNYGGFGSRYDSSFYSGRSRGFGGYDYGRRRSQFDYYPTAVVPFGNQYNVIPGNYHYHQGGFRH